MKDAVKPVYAKMQLTEKEDLIDFALSYTQLRTAVEEEPMFGVFVIGGTIISGKLITLGDFKKLVCETLYPDRSDGPTLVENEFPLNMEVQADLVPKYIYLADATVITSTREITLPYLRVWIKKVDGWCQTKEPTK